MKTLQIIAFIELCIYFSLTSLLDKIERDKNLSLNFRYSKPYVVKRGDTLIKIMKKFHMTSEEFQELNPQLQYNPFCLRIGQIVMVKEKN